MERHKGDLRVESSKPIRNIETIEKEGDPEKIYKIKHKLTKDEEDH